MTPQHFARPAHRVFSTRSLTRDQGGATWKDLVHSFIGPCGVEPLGNENEFVGSLATWQLGCLEFVLANARGVPVRAVPTPRLGPLPNARNVWLGMCLSGGYEIAFGSRATEVAPASIALIDGARPRAITFEGSCELLWVKVPRVFLPTQELDEDHRIIDGTRGAGSLVQHALRGIVDQREQLDLGDTEAIADGVLKLVGAAIAPLQRSSRKPASTHRALALRRVKQHVEQNLGDDALCVQSVANALGMSPRYINKLFATEQTSLMRWTWLRRLERAHLALTSGGKQPIGEVAGALGFKNAAHFSRSFRARYGRSPSSLR